MFEINNLVAMNKIQDILIKEKSFWEVKLTERDERYTRTATSHLQNINEGLRLIECMRTPQ